MEINDPLVNLGGSLGERPGVSLPGRDKNIDPGELLRQKLEEHMSTSSKEEYPNLVPLKDVDTSGRYPYFMPYADNEEIYAQGQSGWEQVGHGILKGLAVAGTTFLQSTIGTINGIAQAIADQRFASFYDNDFNRGLDNINKYLENKYANYYTARELNSEWWEPANLLTGNFLGDKIFKNMGFTAGSILGGAAWTKLLKPVTRALMSGNVKAAEEALQNMEKVIKTVPPSQRRGAMLSSIRDYAQKAVRASTHPLTKADRTTVAILGSVGEGSIEAMHTLNDFRNDLIARYEQKYGVRPSGEDLEEINKAAAYAGNTTFAANIAILSISNFVQLPYILGSSFNKGRKILGAIESAGVKRSGKTIVANSIPSKGLARKVHKFRNFSSLFFSGSEAAEEGLQFVASEGSANYFDKHYQNEDGASILKDFLGYGFDQLLNTKEGMESLVIGGFSGALMQMVGKVKDRGFFGTGGKQAKLSKAAEIAAEAMNTYTLSSYLRDTAASVEGNAAQIAERESLIRQGDILESKDAMHDISHRYIATRVKHGRADLVREDIKEYRQLASTEEGLAQLREDGLLSEEETRETFLRRLENLENHLENVVSIYEALNLKYQGVVDDNGKPVMTPAAIDRLVYAASKIADYDVRIPQLQLDLGKHGIFTDDIVNAIFNETDETKDANKSAVEAIVSQIEGMTSITNTVKEDLLTSFDDLIEVVKRRKSFLDLYNGIENNPEEHTPLEEDPEDSETLTPEQKAAHAEKYGDTDNSVRIETATGFKSYNIGEEVYIGAKLKKGKEGHTTKHFVRGTILGRSSKGNIIIKTDKGKIIHVAPKSFKPYKMGKVKDVEKNPEAAFYLKHINTEIIWNRGKNKGGLAYGTLEFDPETGELSFRNRKTGKKTVINLASFIPKEGFEKGVFYFGQNLELDSEDIDNIKKTAADPNSFINRLRARTITVLKELIDENKEKVEKIQKTLAGNKSRLEEIEKKIISAEKRIDKQYKPLKSGGMNAATRQNIALAKELIKQRDTLIDEIQVLESEQGDLEYAIIRYNEFIEAIDDLPASYDEIMEMLEEDRRELEKLMAHNAKVISNVREHASKLEILLDYLFKRLKNLVGHRNNLLENMPSWEALSTEKLEQIENELALADEVLPERQKELEELRKRLQDTIKSQEILEKEYRIKGELYDRIKKLHDIKVYQETARAEFLADKEFINNLDKSFKAGEHNGGTVYTSGSPSEVVPSEDPKKAITELFSSTTAPTKANMKPRHFREQRFFEKARNIKDRENIKVMIVNKNNEASLGLPGLINYLTEGQEFDEDVIAVVYIRDVNGKRTFIDENGVDIEVVGEVSEEDGVGVDLDSIVVSVLPDSKLTWPSTGETRYSQATPEEAELYSKAWKEGRKELANLQANQTKIFDFEISRGIPKRNITTDERGKNVYERNPVVGTLITEDQLGVQGLVKVSTTGTIATGSNKTVNIPKGRVLIHHQDLFQFLNNRNPTTQEVDILFKALKRLIELGKENRGGLDSTITQFLRGYLFFSNPKGKTPSANQIWVEGGRLHFGNNGDSILFTPEDFYLNESKILSFLRGVYLNVNNSFLSKERFGPFVEIVDIKEDGTLETVTWETYQHFLLSDKYVLKDDHPLQGTSRTPVLTTTIRKPISEEETQFDGKYATIVGNLFTPPVLPKKATPPAAAAPASKGATTAIAWDSTSTYNVKASGKHKEFSFIPDGTTLNYFTYDGGTIPFYAEIDKNGQLIITAIESMSGEESGISAIVEDATQYAAILKEVEKIAPNTATKRSDRDNVLLVFSNRIKRVIEQEYKKSPSPSTKTKTSSISKAPLKYNELPEFTAIVDGKTVNSIPFRGEQLTFIATKTPEGTIEITWVDASPLNKVFLEDDNPTYVESDYKNILSALEKIERLTNVSLVTDKEAADVNVQTYYSILLANKIRQSIADSTTVTTEEAQEAGESGEANNTEAQITNIERRRQESLYIVTQKDIDEGNDVGIRKNEDGSFEGEVWNSNDELVESYEGSLKEVQNKINAKYDEEYIEAVKKGEMTKEQAMQALEEAGRKDSKAYAELQSLEQQPTSNQTEVTEDVPSAPIQASKGNSYKVGDMEVLYDIEIEEDGSPLAIATGGSAVDFINSPGKHNQPEYVKIHAKAIAIEERLKEHGIDVTLVVSGIRDTVLNYYSFIITQSLRTKSTQTAPPTKVEVVNTPNSSEELSKEEERRRKFEEAKNKTPKTKPPQYRRAGIGFNYIKTNVEKERKWWEERFSVPINYVLNILKTTDGGYAFGRLHNAAVEIWERAEEGTTYHEAFEVVWNMFTPLEEKQKILDEFRNRKGSFIDYYTKEKILYREATEYQAKEQLAEEFRDAVLNNKIRSPKTLIGKFIKYLMDFIRNVIYGRSPIREVFEKIGGGYYKTASILDSYNFGDSHYRLADSINAGTVRNVVEDVAIKVLRRMFSPDNNRNIVEFDEGEVNLDALFIEVRQELKEFYEEDVAHLVDDFDEYNRLNILWEAIDNNWDEVKNRTKRYLRSIGIVQKLQKEGILEEGDVFTEDGALDEEEGGSIREANDSHDRNDYIKNDFNYDFKKRAPASVKMLIFSLAEAVYAETSGVININSASAYPAITSKRHPHTQGEMLTSYVNMFNTLLAETTEFNTFKEMGERIKELAHKNATFVRLVNRLKLTTPDEALTKYDWILRTRFFNTLSKMSPEAVFLSIQEEGRAFIQEGNYNDAPALKVSEWLSGMKLQAEKEGSVIYIDREDRNKFKLNAEALPKLGGQYRDKLAFLSSIGIEFPQKLYDKLSRKDRQTLIGNITSLYTYLKSGTGMLVANSRTIEVNGPLKTIARLYLKASGVRWDSTYFDIRGKQRQTYILRNYLKTIINDINSSNTLEELYEKNPHYRTDVHAGSVYLKPGGLLFDENGNKRNTEPLKIKYVQGIEDRENASLDLSTDRLNYAQRLVLEINQNFHENYYVLVPADAKTEWMVEMRNFFTLSEFNNNSVWNRVYARFREYFAAEQEMGDGRERHLTRFADINEETGEVFFNVAKFKEFVDDRVRATIDELIKYKVIELSPQGGYLFKRVDGEFLASYGIGEKAVGGVRMSEADLLKVIQFRTVNYMMNNIEMSKLFFSDIADYKDILKRVKSFTSGREMSYYGDDAFNNAMTRLYNTHSGVELTPKDYGYYTFTDYMNAVVVSDVYTVNDHLSSIKDASGNVLYDYTDINSTDAQAWVTLSGYREIFIKNGGRWTDKHEKKYQYLMALERQQLFEDGILKENVYREELRKADAKLVKAGDSSKIIFPVIKPIGSGIEHTTMRPFLHKTSMVPLSYSAVRGTNLSHLYLKMMRQNVQYAIVESGQKVGRIKAHDIYNQDGSVNDAEFTEIANIPFKYFGIQVETDYVSNKQPKGSQLTKHAYMNLFSNGVPRDWTGTLDEWNNLPENEKLKNKYYREVSKNIELLNKLTIDGYERLLRKFGITESADGRYEIVDKTKVAQLIKDELFRREMPDNVINALELDENGNFYTFIEAMPNYNQIKTILFSIVDKHIVAQRFNGGPKVQVSGTFWEKNRIRKVHSVKNGKPYFVSENLKFYYNDNGKISRMQVMLPCWFEDKLHRAGLDINDPKLISKLPKELLTGIGFRIPTQELNSIDSIEIVGFIPSWMGDTIVLPEEITKKAGSDFDIDKLSTYLKNVHFSRTGDIHVIQYKGTNEETLQFYRDYYDTAIAKAIKQRTAKIERINFAKTLISEAFEESSLLSDEELEKHEEFLADLLEDIDTAEDAREVIENMITKVNSLQKSIEELSNREKQDIIREQFALRKLTQALENEYFNSLDRLIRMPENFDRLVAPNSAEPLKEIRDDLNAYLGVRHHNDTDVLDPIYMSKTRHNYILGKSLVAISAVNQVANALSQLGNVYINDEVLNSLSIDERKFLPDLEIALPHNTVTINGKKRPSLGGIFDRAGKYISQKISMYIDGGVDVAKDPFLVEMGVNSSTASTFLLLEKLGVPSRTVIMFMNQPIIREFIQELESRQQTWVFNEDVRDAVLNRWGSMLPATSINVDNLENNIIKWQKGEEFSLDERAEQKFILNEFLKYSMIASHMYALTEGYKYDTGNFTDAHNLDYTLAKTEKARTQNVFSSIDSILDKTHLRTIHDYLIASRRAIGDTILKIESVEIQKILDPIKEDILKRKRLTRENFKNIAKNLEFSFINFLIHTRNRLNAHYRRILVNDATSTVRLFDKIRREIPADSPLTNNAVFNMLSYEIGDNMSGTKLISLFGKISDALTANTLTESFRELRDNPITNPPNANTTDRRSLYKELMMVALMAGVGKSARNFTEYLPFEDYAPIINDALLNLENFPDIHKFAELDMFYKNNWHNNALVPVERETFGEYRNMSYSKKNLADIFNNTAPWVRNMVDELFPSRGVASHPDSSDRARYLVFALDEGSSNFGAKYIKVRRTAKGVTKKQAIEMASKGDFSGFEYILLRRVDRDGEIALFDRPNSARKFAMYVPANPLGDGVKSQEHYIDPRQSVFNTPVYKFPVERELSDEYIISYYTEHVQQHMVSVSSGSTINVYWGGEESSTNTRLLSNLAPREFIWDGVKYGSVEHAYQTNKTGTFDTVVYNAYLKRKDTPGYGVKISRGPLTTYSESNLKMMRDMVVESFRQLYQRQPDSPQIKMLLSYDNFTHNNSTQKIDEAFIEGLMEAKKLISSFSPSSRSSTPSSQNPLILAGVKPTDMYGHAEKDIAMAEGATQFIGEAAGNASISSTNRYKVAWGNRANTGNYSSSDIIMVSGSGPWRGVTMEQIEEKFNTFYKPLLDKATEKYAVIRVGNAEGMDKLVQDYLDNKKEYQQLEYLVRQGAGGKYYEYVPLNPPKNNNQAEVEQRVEEMVKNKEVEVKCDIPSKGRKKKAKKGLASEITPGGKWEIIKDLKGFPTHEQGGVDLVIGKDGVQITRENSKFKAEFGIVLPKILK